MITWRARTHKPCEAFLLAAYMTDRAKSVTRRSPAIHGRSNGLTPIPPREGLIPRSIMPYSSRSLTTLLLGSNVPPPSVDRHNRLAPCATHRQRNGVRTPRVP